MVVSTKSGHSFGKSLCRIFCRATTSWARVLGGARAMMGTRRERTVDFSAAVMVMGAGSRSSGFAQPLLMRFLK